MTSLYIFGASGQGREVAAMVASGLRGVSADDDSPEIQVAGFLDDDPKLADTHVNGVPVLGDASAYPNGDDSAVAALGVGYPEIKLRVVERVGGDVHNWPTLISADASVAGPVWLGDGCLIQAGAVLTSNVELGDFVTVNVGATVSHDVALGRLVTVSPGANLGGSVKVGEGAFVGIGASVIQGVRIGAWSMIGAGACVTSDVPPNTVVVGVPARVHKTRDERWYRA